MTTTINAQATNGLLTTADGSGIVKLQSDGKTTNSLVWTRFDSSAGSITTNASYNISSSVYNGTGDFNLNFNVSLSDINYGVLGNGSIRDATNNYSMGVVAPCRLSSATYNTAAVRVQATVFGSATFNNMVINFVAIFGN